LKYWLPIPHSPALKKTAPTIEEKQEPININVPEVTIAEKNKYEKRLNP
jgi:hypothetical protein